MKSKIPALLGKAQLWHIELDLGGGGTITLTYTNKNTRDWDYQRYRSQSAYAGHWVKAIREYESV